MQKLMNPILLLGQGPIGIWKRVISQQPWVSEVTASKVVLAARLVGGDIMVARDRSSPRGFKFLFISTPTSDQGFFLREVMYAQSTNSNLSDYWRRKGFPEIGNSI